MTEAETVTIQAPADRVLIQPDEAVKASPGGIVLPDRSRSAVNSGIVISVGPGHLLDAGGYQPLSVKVGQRVWFSEIAGQKIEVDGEEYISMFEQEVIAYR
jgi:chaperonin GroES